MTRPEPARYLLPPQQAVAIFHTEIVPALLADAAAQLEPMMVLLTAQPGAGKSVLARDLRNSFPEAGRPAIVDVDSLRPFYPDYVRLRRQHAAAADDLVQADARRWLDLSLAYLAERKANVIVEHGLRDRDVTNALLDRFSTQQVPYRIEVAVLATPAAESKLGMLERYQTWHERIGLGRYVAVDLHDARYQHLLTVADWLEADPRISAAAVYRLGQAEPVCRMQLAALPRQRTADSRLRTAIRTEREQPWSVERSRSFLALYHSLTARMTPEWRPALEDAYQHALPLLHASADLPRHSRPAVTFGRYQIVSIAHLDTVRAILRDWPTVEIGVLDLDSRPARLHQPAVHLRDFHRQCEANTAPAKNPMTAAERVSFWRATLKHAGLDDRASVRVITRPELDPAAFNRQYPADRVDLVFPAATGDGFDKVRNASFAEILRRPVFTVAPPLELHTSDIRAAYRAGSPTWRNGFAPGGLEAFIAAGGPRRLLGDPGPADLTTIRHLVQTAMHGAPQAQTAHDQRLRRAAGHGSPRQGRGR